MIGHSRASAAQWMSRIEFKNKHTLHMLSRLLTTLPHKESHPRWNLVPKCCSDLEQFLLCTGCSGKNNNLKHSKFEISIINDVNWAFTSHPNLGPLEIGFLVWLWTLIVVPGQVKFVSKISQGSNKPAQYCSISTAANFHILTRRGRVT